MALDRQSIEKKDFPVARRGYDPEAVDAHLSALAEEIAELRRSSPRSGTFASSAAERVRAILEAAETSADDLRRVAEQEARDIREEAANEAQIVREQAADRAREYVEKVSEATHNMLRRLEAMENEFASLVEALRTGSNQLGADLQLLEGNLGEVSASTLSRRTPEAEPAANVEEVAVLELDAVDGVESIDGDGEAAGGEASLEEAGTVGGEAPLEEAGTAGGEAPLEEAGTAGGDAALEEAGPATVDDTEGARLIALNMALNGTPREETDRYLSENFQLADRAGLLDEVYASIGA